MYSGLTRTCACLPLKEPSPASLEETEQDKHDFHQENLQDQMLVPLEELEISKS